MNTHKRSWEDHSLTLVALLGAATVKERFFAEGER